LNNKEIKNEVLKMDTSSLINLDKALDQAQQSYQNNEEDSSKITGTYHYSPDFPVFQGHFPEQPILPALVHIASVRHLMEQALQCKLRSGEIQKTKFSKAVTPGQQVNLDLQVKKEPEGAYTVDFSIFMEKNTVARGIVILYNY
jgi:3-hydroxyacyl-[acyl-carrier-protein] dehydratase